MHHEDPGPLPLQAERPHWFPFHYLGSVTHSASFRLALPIFVLQARFSHGMFTVYPGFGSIPSGGQQIITVECVADPVGRCEEFLAIDISDRDPRENPAGIPYTLLAEACLPGTATQIGQHC